MVRLPVPDLFLPAGDRTNLSSGDYSSSGSDHDPATPFFNLLHGFFFDDTPSTTPSDDPTVLSPDDDSDPLPCRPSSSSSSSVRSVSMLNGIFSKPHHPVRASLLAAVEKHNRLRPDSMGAFRRAVAGSLREEGYNAGVCKSRWDKAVGSTAGTHEYIDIVGPAGDRYLVEVDFAAEFEIARPTEEYEMVLRAVPTVFVGTAEEIKAVVRVVAEEGRRNMRARGMHVPPWRKGRYLCAKWLGGYKRSVNVAADVSVAVPIVACRAVGFEPGRILVQPMGRIR